jgi:hypothetical protein
MQCAISKKLVSIIQEFPGYVKKSTLQKTRLKRFSMDHNRLKLIFSQCCTRRLDEHKFGEYTSRRHALATDPNKQSKRKWREERNWTYADFTWQFELLIFLLSFMDFIMITCCYHLKALLHLPNNIVSPSRKVLNLFNFISSTSNKETSNTLYLQISQNKQIDMNIRWWIR